MTNKVAVEIDFVFGNIDQEVARIKNALTSALAGTKGAGLLGDISRDAGQTKQITNDISRLAERSKLARENFTDLTRTVASFNRTIGSTHVDKISVDLKQVTDEMRGLNAEYRKLAKTVTTYNVFMQDQALAMEMASGMLEKQRLEIQKLQLQTERLSQSQKEHLSIEQQWIMFGLRRLALQGKLSESTREQASEAFKAEKALRELNQQIVTGTKLSDAQVAAMNRHVEVLNKFKQMTTQQGGMFEGLNGMVRMFEAASFRMLMIGFTIQQAISTADAVGRFAIEGSQLIQSRSAYETLTRTTGISPDFAKQIRLGADNLLTELDSIKIAGSLVSGAEGKFLNELVTAGPELTNLARIIAASNPDALEQHGSIAGITKRLIEGIRKKEVELFDEFRIVVRQEQANKDYAEEIGKSASQLSLVEEQIAFLNAVLKEGQVITAQMGGTADSVTDSYLRLGTVFREFGEQSKIWFAQMLMPFATEVSGQSLHDVITRTTARSNYLLQLREQGNAPSTEGSLEQMLLQGESELAQRDPWESVSGGLWEMMQGGSIFTGFDAGRAMSSKGATALLGPFGIPIDMWRNASRMDDERSKNLALAILDKEVELRGSTEDIGAIWSQISNTLGVSLRSDDIATIANKYAVSQDDYNVIATQLLSPTQTNLPPEEFDYIFSGIQSQYIPDVKNQAYAVASFDRMLTGQQAPDLGTNYGELSRNAFTQSILGNISKDVSGYGLLETAASKGASPGEIYNIVNALEDLDEQQKLAAVSSAALSAASVQLFTAASEGQISWVQAAGLVQQYENQLRKLVGYAPEFQAAFTSGLTQAVSQVDPLLGKFLESASSMGADYNDILSVVNATDELTESQREAALAAGQFASKQAMLLRLAEQGIITWEVAANALKAYSRQLLQTSYDITAFGESDYGAFGSGFSGGLLGTLEEITSGGGGGVAAQKSVIDSSARAWVDFFRVIAKDGVDALREKLTGLEEGLSGLEGTFYDTALGAGATADQLIAVAMAMGAGEDAVAAFKAVAAGQAMEVLAKEYLAGRVSAEQVGTAIQLVQSQINSGEDVSLEPLGMDFQAIYRSYQEQPTTSGGGGGGRTKQPTDWKLELLGIAGGQDLTPSEMLDLAVATGAFTDEQLLAGLREEAMGVATEKLSTVVAEQGADNAIAYLEGFENVLSQYETPESLANALTSWYENGISPIDVAIAGQVGVPTMSQLSYVNAVRLKGNVSPYTYGLDPNDPKAQMLREEGLLAQDPMDIAVQAEDATLIASVEELLDENEFTLSPLVDVDDLFYQLTDFFNNSTFRVRVIADVDESTIPSSNSSSGNSGGSGGGGGASNRPNAYADGGYVSGVSHLRGGVNAELEGGEYVIPRSMMSPVVPMLLESLRSNPIAYMPPSNITNKAGNSLTHNNQMSYQIVTNNYYGGNQGFKTELNALI